MLPGAADHRHTPPPQALQARLDALENDNDEKQNALVDNSDDEFIIEEEVDGVLHVSKQNLPAPAATEGQPGRARKKKKKVILSGRRTRGARERHSAQSFAVLLDEVRRVTPPSSRHLVLSPSQAALDTLPDEVPTYLNTAMGPSTTAAPRKFCSVCGSLSTCV